MGREATGEGAGGIQNPEIGNPKESLFTQTSAKSDLAFEGSKFCHITPLWGSLHWFPVKCGIDFKGV